MRVLVTGGAGFVGSHLVDRLIEAGHRVRVLDNLDPQVHGEGVGRPAVLHPDAELRVADVRDRQAVRAALEGVEAVFHQAAAVGVGQSMYEIEHYVSVNSLGAAVVLEALVEKRHQLHRVVVASSMSIYGEGAYTDAAGRAVFPALRSEAQLEARRWELEGSDGALLRPAPTSESKVLAPTSVYATTKRDQEELFLSVGRAYDIPTVALRYFNIYGTRQSLSNPYTGVIAIFSSRVLNGNPPLIFEDGKQSRDFIHVSDIVRANLLALDREEAVGQVYNVGTGRRVTVGEIAELLIRARRVGVQPEITSQYRAGDIRHCFADISRIERDLGFRPEVTLEEGMDELLAWLETQVAEDRVEHARAELEKRGLAR
jgi:dTDP-L-rhamnose 4-epimerase